MYIYLVIVYNNYESIVLSTHFSACVLLTYLNDCFVKLAEKFECKQENKTVMLLNMQSLFLANISLIHTLMHFNYLIIQKLNEKVAFLFISNEFGFVIRINRFQ